MRIRLLVPKSKGWLGQVHKNGKAGIPRLSLTLLAALTPDRHSVEVIDTRFKDPGYDDLPDLVGISAFTGEVNHAYEMADEFRRRGAKVVLGGIHVSMVPDEALEHADTVVIGEAETTWPRVVSDLEQGKLERIYRADGFNDVSGLPTPRRDLLDSQTLLHDLVPAGHARVSVRLHLLRGDDLQRPKDAASPGRGSRGRGERRFPTNAASCFSTTTSRSSRTTRRSSSPP